MQEDRLKDLNAKRGHSSDLYIEYLCCVEIQVTRPEFIEHCKTLYAKQGGRCALSGVTLEYGYRIKNPCYIAIDRLDVNQPYSEANVRIVSLFVKKVHLTWNDDTIFHFAKQITRVRTVAEAKDDE
jgi:hypothetical protein